VRDNDGELSSSASVSGKPMRIEVSPDHRCDSRPRSQIGEDMAQIMDIVPAEEAFMRMSMGIFKRCDSSVGLLCSCGAPEVSTPGMSAMIVVRGV
jgi:hypothetical protein